MIQGAQMRCTINLTVAGSNLAPTYVFVIIITIVTKKTGEYDCIVHSDMFYTETILDIVKDAEV